MSPDPHTRVTVPAEADGTRLDVFLAESAGSRARAQGLIAAGAVRIDGKAARKRDAVSAGSVVEITPLAATEEATDGTEVPYTVVYEDPHLFVVDKPAGVVVHPARGHRSGTLAQALADRGARGGDPERPGIVHRLDRDTSGLLVVARSEAVHRALAQRILDRRVGREYLALVDGHPPARTGTIDAPIGRDRHDRLIQSLDTDAPREARTHFVLERMLPAAALLQVRLETGRTHQIRVHMAAIGHPVSGDPTYGVAGRYGLTRQFLHAARLTFPHPVTGATVDVSSELPDDLADALRRAEVESSPKG